MWKMSFNLSNNMSSNSLYVEMTIKTLKQLIR